MKLAIFASSLAPGGAERVAVNLAREISIAGHQVDLLLVRAEGALLSDVREEVQVVDLAASRAGKSIGALRRYLLAGRPDALLAINFEANLAAALASSAAGSRALLVLSIHMPIAPWLGAFSWPRARLMALASKLAYRRADRLVVPSRGIARDVERSGWAKGGRIAVIHNPVLPEGLGSLSSEVVNDPWLSDPEVPCLVTLGRLTALKNLSLLISAFKRVREQRHARLLIVGEGEKRSELERQIAEFGLSDAVRLFGYAANPFPILKAADLFVLSSNFEGFGNVLVEAMAVGTPVVSTDCPYGPREILEDGRWGRLVPPGDPEALACAILESLDRPLAPGERPADFGAANRSADYLRLFERALSDRSASN